MIPHTAGVEDDDHCEEKTQRASCIEISRLRALELRYEAKDEGPHRRGEEEGEGVKLVEQCVKLETYSSQICQ